ATHHLQPLNFGLFSPLGNYYSQGLNSFTNMSLRQTTMTKSFFGISWPAFEKALTKENVLSAWRKTWIFPFDPEVVLSKL
ncbi:hypothetical protein K470DRAFT_195956, partial [Piedraia hortae CBS 480.64]